MVFINSIKTDPSTNDVIDWLKSNSKISMEFIRLNPEDTIGNLEIQFQKDGGENVVVTVNVRNESRTIDFENVKSYWYRRGGLENKSGVITSSTRIEFDIQNYLDKEWNILEEFILNRLKEKRGLGNIKDNQLNKIEVLMKAARIGIDIPKTTIATSKAAYIKNRLITKSLYHGGFSIEDKYSVGSLTQPVSNMEEDMDVYFPSLFQEEIAKKYELRIFYFCGEFYSAAIFSQANEKTVIDFRNYDKERPNRVVPYKLPDNIKSKLGCLMNELQLETGSIDMVFTPEGRYVFLEVNPVGQFNQVSIPCNYHLEEKIANYLLYEQ